LCTTETIFAHSRFQSAPGALNQSMEAGKWIRALREERLIKPSDVERITRAIADTKRNTDFYVPHSTLADIESGSIPSIHKLFSLAISLKVPLDELLLLFGIDPKEINEFTLLARTDAPQMQHRFAAASASEPPFRFALNFDTNSVTQETTLLRLRSQDTANFPAALMTKVDPVRYRYAVIGTNDDSMGDLLPSKSIVQIDTSQNTVRVFAWKSLRERPIYLIWHTDGHTCCWCQADGRELILVPHPASQQPVRRFKMPREANVVGRVTNAWLPFESAQLNCNNAS
jgi:transcriptional regulator with XRE-family HTH domain